MENQSKNQSQPQEPDKRKKPHITEPLPESTRPRRDGPGGN